MSTVAARVLCALTAVGLAGALAGCFGHTSSRTVTVPWTVVRSSPSSPSVAVQYYHGACDSQPRARVASDSTSVHISVSVVERPGPCSDVAVISYARVRLDAPLGTRSVLGSCDAATNTTSCWSGGPSRSRDTSRPCRPDRQGNWQTDSRHERGYVGSLRQPGGPPDRFWRVPIRSRLLVPAGSAVGRA
jgi:hypothetical protein